jgi:hypothetical protein
LTLRRTHHLLGRTFWILIGLGLTTASLAACGSTNPPSTLSTDPPHVAPPTARARAELTRAVSTTSSLTSSFEMTFTRSSAPGVSSTPLAAHGAGDFRSSSGTIVLELPGGSSETEQMIFLPGTVFIKPPASSLPLQPGRPWIFANFVDIAKYNVNFPPYIVQTESVNPALAISELTWGITAAASDGHETFHGLSTTHYLATVDLRQALSRASGPAGSVFAATISSEIAALGGSTASTPVSIHLDAWVDGSGRLTGVRFTPAGAGIGTLTLSLDRFGSAVHAGKPPRAKVVDIAAMIPGGEREALNGGDSDGA